MSKYDIRCFRDCYRKVSKSLPMFPLPDLPQVVININGQKDKLKKSVNIDQVRLSIK